MRKPEVCILPVAGLSTRNLPATKALHKGFLTLHSLPIIQYAVNACAEIGIKEVVFIYSDQSCKHFQPIFPIKAVDTTAAGDTFTGYFIAGLAQGMEIPDILRMSAKASSIAVSRAGAVPSIPYRNEVIASLEA